jgi:hypothetical protein
MGAIAAWGDCKLDNSFRSSFPKVKQLRFCKIPQSLQKIEAVFRQSLQLEVSSLGSVNVEGWTQTHFKLIFRQVGK